MLNQPTLTLCKFLPYRLPDSVPSDASVYDVSSYADFPDCTLSPMWEHGGIPIPGMLGKTSDSVEGIWQGLKVIDGKTAPRYFSGQGQKRGGKPRGHQYDGKLLGMTEAREKIYRVAKELIASFLALARNGKAQYFHDVSDNGNISAPDEGCAHAAVPVQYLNQQLQNCSAQDA